MEDRMQTVDTAEEIAELINARNGGRTSRGGVLVDEFVDTGAAAATEVVADEKERDATVISANNHIRKHHLNIWVKKSGETGIVFLDLDQASDEVLTAYRSRPGRRAGSNGNGSVASNVPRRAAAAASKAKTTAAVKKSVPAKRAKRAAVTEVDVDEDSGGAEVAPIEGARRRRRATT